MIGSGLTVALASVVGQDSTTALLGNTNEGFSVSPVQREMLFPMRHFYPYIGVKLFKIAMAS